MITAPQPGHSITENNSGPGKIRRCR